MHAGRSFLLFMVIGLLCCVAHAEQLPERTTIDGVAAYINEQAVTIGEVMMMIEPVRRKLVLRYDGEELRQRLEAAYQEALQALIERQLILQAYEQLDQQIPEWAIENRLNEIISEMFNDDREQLMDVLEQEGVNYDEWRERIRQQMIVANMRNSFVEDTVHISPAELNEYYQENLDKYREPARIKLSMIVLDKGKTAEEAARKRELAEDLRRRALAGEDFGVLAKRFSTGSRASRGGDWDWIDPEATLRKELADAVAELSPSGISQVIELGELFYIIKLDGRKAKTVRSFEVARDEIERELRRQESARIYNEWISRLKKDARIHDFERQVF